MRQVLPVPQRVMAVVLSVLFVFCPFAAYAAGETDAAADPVLLPIIMYHEVKPDKSGKDAIQPWEFETDLKWLANNGYTTIVMADLIAYVRDGTPLPEKPIILSFDDGYYNNYVYVLPLLQQYSARIVLSLLGRNTDDFTEWPSKSIDYAHVTWSQLNEMLDTGLVEVQNHSYDLHAYTSERHGCMQNRGESDAAYTQLLRADLQRLQDELAEHTGRTRHLCLSLRQVRRPDGHRSTRHGLSGNADVRLGREPHHARSVLPLPARAYLPVAQSAAAVCAPACDEGNGVSG